MMNVGIQTEEADVHGIKTMLPAHRTSQSKVKKKKNSNTDLGKIYCIFCPNVLGVFMMAMQHQHYNLNGKTGTRASQISCDIYCTYPIRQL